MTNVPILNHLRFNRFMTNVPMKMEALKKTATGDGGF